MLVERQGTRRHDHALTLGVAVALLLAVALVAMLGRSGAFSRLVPPPVATAPVLPGLTVDDEAPGPGTMPVVTSLQSGSQAERLGIEVGDRIDAVDGRAVRDVDALRDVVADSADGAPVSLLIRRGNAVWTIALNRAAPRDARLEPVSTRHDPQDPARRGR